MESPVVQAVILGVIQGLTEFLPVSSSGHLALAQKLIPGFEQPGVLLDVMLHVGTLAAVLVYFRKDLIELAMVLIRFVTGNKTDEDGRRFVRCRLVARGLKPRREGSRDDLFAAMPPLEAKKMLFALVVGERGRRRRPGKAEEKIMLIDAKKGTPQREVR